MGVEPLYLGIDLGTSGVRAQAIDPQGRVHAAATAPLPPPDIRAGRIEQDPALWWEAVCRCLEGVRAGIDLKRIRAIAVDGTSGTLVLCDRHGTPLAPALMYNDRRPPTCVEPIARHAPPASGAHGASSALAKLLWLQTHTAGAAYALSQADWVSGRLAGTWGHSDYNNALKLGYDPVALTWPDWLAAAGARVELLPQVHAPGEVIGTIDPAVAAGFGLARDARVVAGTTDGVAAFLAAGADAPGHGVTALGSTLVLKLLSARPVFSAAHGVYSHRLHDAWLVGGASNTGGAVLRQFFTQTELDALTPQLRPDEPTGLDYYPLPGTGERFPVNDPHLAPRLEPRPADRVRFLQGLLEGIARIEAEGYRLLHTLGAPRLAELRSSGGGSANLAWTRIRERLLQVPLRAARSEHAAYGAARLAAGLAGAGRAMRTLA